MKPSDKVIKAPIVRFTIEDLKEWVEFIAYLPITQKIWTNIPDIKIKGDAIVEDESESDRKRGNKFNVHLALEPEYNDIDLIPMIAVWYNNNDRAHIESNSYSSTPLTDELEARTDIFGFEGSWEEVTLKLIELNNIVNSSVPKMGDEVRQAEVKK